MKWITELRKQDWVLIGGGTFLLANPIVLLLLFEKATVVCILTAFTFGYLTLVAAIRSHHKWIAVVLLNVIVILSMFLDFEVLFRYRFPEYVIEDLYTLEDGYYFNKPGLNKVFRDKEYDVRYNTNVQGFRVGSSHLEETIVTKCDWLFVGDSYTQGAQVEFEELFSSLLYNDFPDKIIMNAGVSGLGLSEELHLIKDLGNRLRPRKVILQICNFNDFMNVESAARGGVDYLMHYSDLLRFLLFRWRYKQPGELPLGRWTEPFYPSVEDNIDYNIFYKISSEKKEADKRAFRDYLTLINGEVNRMGAELVVFLVPTKEQTYYRYFAEVVDAFHIDVRNLDMEYPNRLLSRLCDSLGIPLVDLSDRFRNDQEEAFFEFDEHLNVHGHELVAQSLKGILADIQNRRPVSMLSKASLGDRYPSAARQTGQLLFQSSREENMEIFMGDTSFEHVNRLTFNNVDESHPSFCLGDSAVVFTEGDARTYRTKVCILNLKTGERRTITNDPNQFGAIPKPSPDGRSIAYAQWYYDEKSKSFSLPQIVCVDLDRGTQMQITKNNCENWRPVYAPDNKHMCYVSRIDGNLDIYEYDMTKGTEYRLTRTPYDEWDPSYSFEGEKIVYAANVDGNWDLFELNTRNGLTRRLTTTLGDEWDPTCLRGGTQILYAGEYGLFRGIYSLKILPVCIECKHVLDGDRCAAFDRMPDEIYSGQDNRKKPLADQINNIVFEEK